MERINCASSEPGMSINLTEIMFTMLNTIIFRCSLGDNFNKDHVDSFGRLIKKATTLMESMCFEDFFPLLKWVDVLNGFQGKLDTTSQELDNFFNQVIDDHLRSEEHGCKDDKKMNFIDLLLLHAEEDNLNLSRDNIKGIIMDMFVGGSDTTATAVEWSMAELIKNPRLMKKAQEEIYVVRGVCFLCVGCKTLVFGIVGRSASARSLANRSLAFQMRVLYFNVPEEKGSAPIVNAEFLQQVNPFLLFGCGVIPKECSTRPG
ncbi:hypothetical protein MKW98_007108 [Papaver atlanticum]|uniref:Cytochrome P450 n=1 Tax=Papaver atlanticum TaxID=357466 RepID=A0AAD4SN61_9MAGN|nr:hypothetical protein MKW98_007108 [Papaver atlanticum]